MRRFLVTLVVAISVIVSGCSSTSTKVYDTEKLKWNETIIYGRLINVPDEIGNTFSISYSGTDNKLRRLKLNKKIEGRDIYFIQVVPTDTIQLHSLIFHDNSRKTKAIWENQAKFDKNKGVSPEGFTREFAIAFVNNSISHHSQLLYVGSFDLSALHGLREINQIKKSDFTTHNERKRVNNVMGMKYPNLTFSTASDQIVYLNPQKSADRLVANRPRE